MRGLVALRAFGWRGPLALVAALLLVVAGCGLPLDDSPSAIDADNLPDELRLGQLPTPTARPVSSIGPGSDQIFMLQENRLITVERQIVESPDQLIEILLQGTFPQERAEGIESALLRGTRVQNVAINDLFDLAIVDLAPGSIDPRNSEQRLAFAQIVYTLTSLPNVELVQFVQTDPNTGVTIDLAVQTDGGTRTPGTRVSRNDFALLNPDAVPRPAFDLPVSTPTPTPDPDAPPRFELPIWMLDGNDDLTQVSRTIERTPEAFLVALVGGVTTDERERGVRSALPPDALPNSVSVDTYDVEDTDQFGFASLISANIAIVDLGAGSLPSVENGSERLLAVAQIVFTLTGLAEIDRVAFFVEGQPIPIGFDQGVSLPFDPNIPAGLTRDDFTSALPAQPVTTPTPPAAPAPAAEPAAPAATADEPAEPQVVPTPTPG